MGKLTLKTIPSTVACFEFSVLTASRSQGARGAKWEEINFRSATWEIPGTRTKTGKAFRVPLSSRAVEILEEQKAKTGGFVSVPCTTMGPVIRCNGFQSCFRPPWTLAEPPTA